jgi:flagellar protein FliS
MQASHAGQSAVHAYTTQQVSRSEPLHLVVQLYDGAIGGILQAQELYGRDDRLGTNRSLGRALDIIGELQACLDLAQGGEVAHNLDRVYHYVRRRLLAAQLEDDPSILDEVVALLRPLREAWAEAHRIHQRGDR